MLLLKLLRKKQNTMSCSKHDKVMFNIINSLEKTKFKFSWWKANNVSVTFTNTSLKCAIQIELNSIVERENDESTCRDLSGLFVNHKAEREREQAEKKAAKLEKLHVKSCSNNVMWCHETMWCHVMLSCRDVETMWCCHWRRREEEQRHWRRRKEEQRYCDAGCTDKTHQKE